MTLANKITLCRILLIPVFCALACGYGPSRPEFRNAALIVFVLAASTDVLDGWVARRFGQQTRLGKRLDPLADKLLVNLGFIFLAANPHFTPGIPLWLPVLIVLRDSIMVLGAMLLNAFVGPVIVRVRFIGKITTFVLMLTLLGTLMEVPFLPWLVGLATLAVLGSCGGYIHDGIQQLRTLKAHVHGQE